jgi:MFS transporter, DHA2 family, multidrug resistance protein
VIIALGIGAIFSADILTPLWLQSQMGYRATWAGLAAAWREVLAMLDAPAAGRSRTSFVRAR